MIDLQPFCSRDSSRPGILKPFSLGHYTYATDGRMLIRVARRDDVPTNPDAPRNVDSLYPDPSPSPRDYSPLPLPLPVAPVEYKNCADCDGQGHFKNCPECHGLGLIECDKCLNKEDCHRCRGKGVLYTNDVNAPTCTNCDGSGKVAQQRTLQLGNKVFNVMFLEKLAILPGITIAADHGDEFSPMMFSFDGGCGLLMPMRL
ncbi:MAG: hypothetical protein KGL39_58045 [Patescibacteria group bacterium]|nr:hypothetical protein [Patescibacteria group bacterium]